MGSTTPSDPEAEGRPQLRTRLLIQAAELHSMRTAQMISITHRRGHLGITQNAVLFIGPIKAPACLPVVRRTTSWKPLLDGPLWLSGSYRCCGAVMGGSKVVCNRAPCFSHR